MKDTLAKRLRRLRKGATSIDVQKIQDMRRFVAVRNNGKRDSVGLYRRAGHTYERFVKKDDANGEYVPVHDMESEIEFVIEVLPENHDPLTDYTFLHISLAWQKLLGKLKMELRRPEHLLVLVTLSRQVAIADRAAYLRGLIVPTFVRHEVVSIHPADSHDSLFGLPILSPRSGTTVPIGK